jgi:hypothetical protein
MAAPKRTKAEREHDLSEIGRLYVQGQTCRQIAETLSADRAYTVSHATVGRDIGTLLQRWREEQADSIHEAKIRELEHFRLIEAEAWAAWEKSKAPATKDLNEVRDGLQGYTRTQRITETRVGDPRFLQAAHNAAAKRAEILGLNDTTLDRIEAMLRKLEGRPPEGIEP